MERRSIVTVIGAVSTLPMALNAATPTKPNVVLIYTDDHRYSGVHACAGEDVITPNLDKLAAEGVLFTNAYLQGAFVGATSVASRAMLLTGRNLFDINAMGHMIPKDHTTIGESFMAAGYHAHHVGKWHQDHKSLSRSYNTGSRVVGTPAYLVDQFRMPFVDWNSEGKLLRSDCYLLEYDKKGKVIKRPLADTDKGGPTADENHAPHVSEVLADDAIAYIKGYDKEKPMYMYFALPCPHDPRQAPKKYRDMYPNDKITLPPSYMDLHPFDNGHQILRDEELAPFPRTEEIAKQHLGDYYAIITHLDEQIGRVIAQLKKSGMYDNTIIVMAGDSGLAVGCHGLIGKQNVYNEDGTHIPFILSGGALDKSFRGRREEALCYVHDIMPTILDVAGVNAPKSVTGKSLKPVLEGKKKSINNYIYNAYYQFQRAYIKDDFKLIEYVKADGYDKQQGNYVAGSRVTQLFNLKDDPWECHNLAYLPQHKERLVKMRQEMRQAAMELGDYADGKRIKFDFWHYYDN